MLKQDYYHHSFIQRTDHQLIHTMKRILYLFKQLFFWHMLSRSGSETLINLQIINYLVQLLPVTLEQINQLLAENLLT